MDMADPPGARDDIKLVRLPKLTKAQCRRIQALRNWEERSELRLLGYRARKPAPISDAAPRAPGLGVSA